jgi:hypothetical protein
MRFKLHEKSTASKREHPALQNMKFRHFFFVLWFLCLPGNTGFNFQLTQLNSSVLIQKDRGWILDTFSFYILIFEAGGYAGGWGGGAEFAIDTDRMTEKSIFNSRNSTFRLQQRENTREYMASSCVFGTVYLCSQKRGGSKPLVLD